MFDGIFPVSWLQQGYSTEIILIAGTSKPDLTGEGWHKEMPQPEMVTSR